MMNDFYNFGLTFSGRLSEEQIKFALDYLEFNEWGLALETLCDYLCEAEVEISSDEYLELVNFNQKMGMPVSNKTLLYLKSLIFKQKQE